MSNPLDPIMGWYQVALDSMRITSRVIERDIRAAFTVRHTFLGSAAAENLVRVRDARDQVGDLVVLALVAIFERTLRDFLSQQSRLANPVVNPLDEAIRSELLKDMEFWRLSDRVLGVFSHHVNANVIGQVKQIVEYRNWVAHGRSSSDTPSTDVVPQFAYKVLTEFLDSAGIL